MRNNDSPWNNLAALQAMWATAQRTRHDFDAVVTERNAAKLIGEVSVFERGPHLPIAHCTQLKPHIDAFLMELKAKDGASAKRRVY